MTIAAAPFRFVLTVLSLWCVGRAVFLLWPFGTPATSRALAEARSPSMVSRRTVAPIAVAALEGGEPPVVGRWSRHRAALPPLPPAIPRAAVAKTGEAGVSDGIDPLPAPPAIVEQTKAVSLVGPLLLALPPTASARPALWSGSAWLFERRGGSGGSLAGASLLGGSQAGVRIARRLTGSGNRLRLDLFGRYSRALHVRQTEAAAGIDMYPAAGVPLRLSLERRVAIDEGGRDAWAASLVGGFSRSLLAGSAEVDGYGQAGLVGARSRDAFIEGAVRILVPVGLGGGARLMIGAGGWGAAQPDAARVDVGPRVAVAIPVQRAVATVAVEGRFRTAGDARPGSGVALTAAIDF